MAKMCDIVKERKRLRVFRKVKEGVKYGVYEGYRCPVWSQRSNSK